MPFGIGGRKNAQQVDRSQFLRSYPLKNPVVVTRVDDKGDVSLEVPLQKPSKWVRLFVTPPEKKVIKLDAVGSFVWQRCDGAHTVQDIIDEISSTFKLTKAEASVSLGEFMKDLGKRGLVAFYVGDQVRQAEAELAHGGGVEGNQDNQAQQGETGAEGSLDAASEMPTTSGKDEEKAANREKEKEREGSSGSNSKG